jgi:hypothetical protein
MKATSLVSAILLLTVAAAPAATIHVPGDQPTIQAGINAAAVGDTVLVAAGTYTGANNKNLEFGGKDLTLVSEDGSNATIIDCEGSGRGLFIHQGEVAVVRGFTVRNGSVGSANGGGILLREASLTLANCVLRNNSAQFAGGGMQCENAPSLTIEGCSFIQNHSDNEGGGLRCFGTTTVHVSGCEFRANSTASNHHGGGMLTTIGTVATVTNSVFIENSAHYGAGLACGGATEITDCLFIANEAIIQGGGVLCGGVAGTIHVFQRCTFYDNAALHGGGLSILANNQVEMDHTLIAFSRLGTGVHGFSSTSAVLACCDIFGNAGGDWQGIPVQGQEGIRGNFSADPLFCDPENGNLTIQSDSPCAPPGVTNCGLVGALPVGCGPTSIEDTTWGQIKAIYR